MLLYDGTELYVSGIWDSSARTYHEIENTRVTNLFSAGRPNIIGFSPQGNYLAIEKVVTKGQIFVIPQPTYKTEVNLWDVEKQQVTARCKLTGRIPICVSSSGLVATIPEMPNLINSIRRFVYDDTRIEIVDLASGKVVAHCQPDKQRYLKTYTDYTRTGAFSPDGKRLAVAVSVITGEKMVGHDEVRVYDTSDGKLLLAAPDCTVFSFSDDGDKIALYALNKGLSLWDVNSGKTLWNQPGFQMSGTQNLSVGADRVAVFGKMAGADEEKSIYTFDLKTGEKLYNIKTAEPVTLELAAPDDRVVAVHHPVFQPVSIETYDAATGKSKDGQEVTCSVDEPWHEGN